MTTPTAEDSRALLAEQDWMRVHSTLGTHLRAALDREAVMQAELERLRAAGNNLRALFRPYARDDAQLLAITEWDAALAQKEPGA